MFWLPRDLTNWVKNSYLMLYRNAWQAGYVVKCINTDTNKYLCSSIRDHPVQQRSLSFTKNMPNAVYLRPWQNISKWLYNFFVYEQLRFARVWLASSFSLHIFFKLAWELYDSFVLHIVFLIHCCHSVQIWTFVSVSKSIKADVYGAAGGMILNAQCEL